MKENVTYDMEKPSQVIANNLNHKMRQSTAWSWQGENKNKEKNNVGGFAPVWLWLYDYGIGKCLWKFVYFQELSVSTGVWYPSGKYNNILMKAIYKQVTYFIYFPAAGFAAVGASEILLLLLHFHPFFL